MFRHLIFSVRFDTTQVLPNPFSNFELMTTPLSRSLWVEYVSSLIELSGDLLVIFLEVLVVLGVLNFPDCFSSRYLQLTHYILIDVQWLDIERIAQWRRVADKFVFLDRDKGKCIVKIKILFFKYTRYVIKLGIHQLEGRMLFDKFIVVK